MKFTDREAGNECARLARELAHREPELFARVRMLERGEALLEVARGLGFKSEVDLGVCPHYLALDLLSWLYTRRERRPRGEPRLEIEFPSGTLVFTGNVVLKGPGGEPLLGEGFFAV